VKSKHMPFLRSVPRRFSCFSVHVANPMPIMLYGVMRYYPFLPICSTCVQVLLQKKKRDFFVWPVGLSEHWVESYLH